MPKRVLFIDRDGTLVLEPENYQLDSLTKLEFYPKVFQFLSKIAKNWTSIGNGDQSRWFRNRKFS